MKGIYILDFDDEVSFICVANDYNEAKNITNNHKQLYQLDNNLEGSYHFYPIYENELDLDAEIRMYKKLKNDNPNNIYYTTKNTLDILAKGTWKSNIKVDIPKSVSSDCMFKLSV